MHTVTASRLKNRLGEMLDAASWKAVAVTRHGKVVAYLVPAASHEGRRPPADARRRPPAWGRAAEERALRLCSGRDFRPSRWARAGDREFLAGLAALLASLPEFDRAQMLSLAEALSPGMSRSEVFQRWLDRSPLDPARFVPMLRERLRDETARR